MLISRRILPSLAILATLSVSCKDKPAENAVDAAPSAAVMSASAAPLASAPPAMSASAGHEDGEGKGGGRGGPAAMLLQAARTLEVKDEQKAKIDAAEKAIHEGGGEASRLAMKDASKELHAELVAGIKAGKIDSAKLDPKYAAVEKAVAAGQAKEAEGLNALHAALDATQRKAVVANVRAKQAAREAKMAAHEDAGASDGGKGPNGPSSKRAIERLTRGLDLDTEQQKKVDALAVKEDAAAKPHAEMAEMKKSVDAMLTAFEKDTFDAKKLDAFDAKKARAPMEQQAKLLGQLLPILKPEQREKLATKMEKGPSPHGRRGGFGHRPGGGGGGGDGDGDGD